jgi:hypothetical protein
MDMLSNQWVAFLSIQLRRPRHELNRQKLMQVSTSTLDESFCNRFSGFTCYCCLFYSQHLLYTCIQLHTLHYVTLDCITLRITHYPSHSTHHRKHTHYIFHIAYCVFYIRYFILLYIKYIHNPCAVFHSTCIRRTCTAPWMMPFEVASFLRPNKICKFRQIV